MRKFLLSLQQFHLKVFRGGYVLLKGLARLTCIYESRQSCCFLISKFLQVWKPMDCLTYVGLIWPPLVVLVEIHRNDMCDVSILTLMKSLSLCRCIGSAKVSSDALCSPTLPWLKQGFQVHVELCKAVAWTWKKCDFPPLKFTKVGILRTCNSFPFFWFLFLVSTIFAQPTWALNHNDLAAASVWGNWIQLSHTIQSALFDPHFMLVNYSNSLYLY